jgi:hypothetical protein
MEAGPSPQALKKEQDRIVFTEIVDLRRSFSLQISFTAAIYHTKIVIFSSQNGFELPL